MKISSITHELAYHALSGEHGQAIRATHYSLTDRRELEVLSENMRYAMMVKLAAEEAPLCLIEGERIVGSATLPQARHCQTPVPGLFGTNHTTPRFNHVL